MTWLEHMPAHRWYASGTSGPGFACAANNGKTWVDFEQQGAPSTWVGLRARIAPRAAYG
jgi:hypothetical protein